MLFRSGYDNIQIEENRYEETKWALSMTAGYDFRVTDWLAVGVNYSGFQVGSNCNNGFNGKISWIF